LSFHATKVANAGEVGAITTNDMALAHRARLLINHAENFGVKFVGYNYRLNEVSACIAYHGLEVLQNNTPYLTPYFVKKRGPEDRPYLSQHLGRYPAFSQYMRKPLPIADRLCRRVLCVR
jgi:dTDP-4-amino-4,6-dideoxygalactose transaminase